MQSASARTRIELCGRLAVELRGRRVEDELPGRQGRLLLAYLALHRARPVTRSELVDARVDVEEAAAAVEAAATAGHDPARRWEAAAAALAVLDRRLLPGLEAEWIDERRRELDALHADALEAAAAAGLELGGERLAAAERAAARLVEAAPFRETGHVLRIRALEARGNVAEALLAFDRLRTLLRDELGVTPSPAAQALGDRLLGLGPDAPGGTGAVAPAPPPATAPPPAPPAVPPPPELATGDRGPLLGREAELERLRDFLDEARAGDGRVVLVAGEPGIGKTRLAAELAAEAHGGGATVLFGRADEQGLLPFQPWVEALRHLVRHRPAAGVEPPLAVGAAELARLVPELAARLPEAGRAGASGEEAATERFRLFEAIRGLLAAAAAAAPVLLVLDDLHWADAATLLLLRHVARAPEPLALMVLGTYRDTEVEGTELERALAALRREHALERLALGGLSPDDVDRLARREGGAAAPGLARALHEETAGNPFFVEELVRHARERPEEVARLAERPPEGVRDVVARRLADLDAAALRALELGAVIGREFGIDLLAGASGEDEDALAEALEHAVRARALEEVPDRVGRYAFAHALVRGTLYGGLTATRRARLHARVAAALEARGAERGPPLAALAYHGFHALPAWDPARAARHAEAAAAEASAQLGFEEAAAHLRRAVASVEQDPGAPPERRCDLLLALGEAARRGGDGAEARRSCAAAAALARELGSGERLARAALGFAGPGHGRTGVAEPGVVGLLEEGLAALGDEVSALRARLLSRLAVELYWSEAAERRAALAAEGVELARRAGDAPTLALALASRQFAAWSPDNLGERLALTAEAIPLAAATGGLELALEVRLARIANLFELGDFDAADAEIEAYTAQAEDLRRPAHLFYVPVLTGYRALLEGRLADAERAIEEIRERGRRAQDPNAEPMAALKLLFVRREQDRAAEPAPQLTAAAESHPGVPLWLAMAAFAAAEAGAAEAARAQLDRLMARFGELRRDMLWLPTAGFAAEACVALAEPRHASVLHAALLPHAERNLTATIDAAFGCAARTLGGLEALLGRADEAERHFELALERNAAWGARPWLAHTEHQYGALLRARGRPGDAARARELGSRAGRTARELGLTALARRVAQRAAA